ncbi:MAG: DUF1987 domain-containing protein [Bacteroidales bacterium]|jgi:hypothetical protein|nr:DUF1987 domain-containing protein [Bacteroidales bacterium]
MKILNIAATNKSPRIFFDPAKKLFEIKGNSRPENVRDFFYPILETLRNYFDSAAEDQQLISGSEEKPFTFNFKLDYFNSSSAKFISDILVIVKDYSEKGICFKVYWYFEDGDDDMKEVGEDFSDMISFPFNYIMVQR